MRLNLLALTLTIVSLTIFSNIRFSVAKPFSSIIQTAQQPVTPAKIDRQVAVEQIFKNGKIDSNWCSPDVSGGITAFQTRVLDLKQKATQYFGAYQSVRADGSKYIAKFDRGEVVLEFRLDRMQRIIGVDAKPK